MYIADPPEVQQPHREKAQHPRETPTAFRRLLKQAILFRSYLRPPPLREFLIRKCLDKDAANDASRLKADLLACLRVVPVSQWNAGGRLIDPKRYRIHECIEIGRL